MTVLDENILEGQRLRLESWRIAARQIGVDIGRKGMKDEEIVVLLRTKRKATFFTRDAGFYLRELRHKSYCLAVMSVGQNEVASFIRRFLRLDNFDHNRLAYAFSKGHLAHDPCDSDFLRGLCRSGEFPANQGPSCVMSEGIAAT